MAARNDGAPGVNGVTFKAIEESGVEGFLEQIGNELKTNIVGLVPNAFKAWSRH
jgi:hypothetical protein